MMRDVSTFSLLHMDIQFSQQHILKRLLSSLYFLRLLSKISWMWMYRAFVGSLFSSVVLYMNFVCWLVGFTSTLLCSMFGKYYDARGFIQFGISLLVVYSPSFFCFYYVLFWFCCQSNILIE
jgi:CBS domain containing-hemolysin-like protein